MASGIHLVQRVAGRQQFPPLMAFSVQFAADFTSSPAPRTVLQAATAKAAPTITNDVILRTMLVAPYPGVTIMADIRWRCRLHSLPTSRRHRRPGQYYTRRLRDFRQSEPWSSTCET